MHFSTLCSVVLACAATAAAYNYPYQINDTTKYNDPFFLTLQGAGRKNLHWDGHNIQLRPAANGLLLAVVDPTSPVLRAQLHNHVLQSEVINETTTYYSPSGYVAGFNEIAPLDNGKLRRYQLAFSNGSATTSSNFQKSSRGFFLSGGGVTNDGLYDLDHSIHIPKGGIIVYGFIVCPVKHYYEVMYVTYTARRAPIPRDCTYTFITTTIGPLES